MMKNLMIVMLVTVVAMACSPAFAVSISVTNPSFTGGSTAGWTGFNSYGAGNGVYAGDATDNLPPDGWTGYMRYDNSYMKQVLAETIDDTKAYTVTVETAVASTRWPSGVGVELYADNGGAETRIDAVQYAGLNQLGWGLTSLQVAGSDLTPYAGQTLGVKLLGGGPDRGHFDNVQVEKTDVSASFGSPTAISVPDWTFSDGSGTYDRNWTTTYWTGSPWRGGGWPMPDGSYGNPSLDGNFAVNSTYQLLSDTFVEGARYTLTAQVAARGGSGQGFLAFYSSDRPISAEDAGYPHSGILDGTFVSAVNGTWDQQSLTYIATAADAGKQIGIYLGDSYGHQTVFDQIELTVELSGSGGVIPEPAGLGLLGLSLLAVRRKRS